MIFNWNRGGRKQEMEAIAALKTAVEALQRDSKVIRLEWEDVYDRVTRTMGRLNARIRKSESIPTSEHDDQPLTLTKLPEGASPSGTHAMLAQARARRN